MCCNSPHYLEPHSCRPFDLLLHQSTGVSAGCHQLVPTSSQLWCWPSLFLSFHQVIILNTDDDPITGCCGASSQVFLLGQQPFNWPYHDACLLRCHVVSQITHWGRGPRFLSRCCYHHHRRLHLCDWSLTWNRSRSLCPHFSKDSTFFLGLSRVLFLVPSGTNFHLELSHAVHTRLRKYWNLS